MPLCAWCWLSVCVSSSSIYSFGSRCSPGFYGNPMVIGNSCKRCNCNSNSDPNLIFNECHNVTGHCQHCWGNTAGANCERCAPGFYGDAISAKNCKGGKMSCLVRQRQVSSVLDRHGILWGASNVQELFFGEGKAAQHVCCLLSNVLFVLVIPQ